MLPEPVFFFSFVLQGNSKEYLDKKKKEEDFLE